MRSYFEAKSTEHQLNAAGRKPSTDSGRHLKNIHSADEVMHVVLSNCGAPKSGGEQPLFLSGSVRTKSAHGALSALDVPAFQYARVELFVLMAAWAAWVYLVYIKHRPQCVSIQFILFANLCLALIHSVLKNLNYAV